MSRVLKIPALKPIRLIINELLLLRKLLMVILK
jgi:hypothetical protein